MTMANEQQLADGLPQISIDDLLKMIGDRDVTIQRQGLLIAQQAARLAELDESNGKASDVTTTTFDTSSMSIPQ
jgi:hypothetical protein